MSQRKKRLKGLKVRAAQPQDLAAIYLCQTLAYAGMPKEDLCSERLLAMQLAAFPEGILLAEAGGDVVGYATCLIVQLDHDSPWYSYNEITG